MQTFIINDDLHIKCERKETRMCFKHEGTLYRDNEVIDFEKIMYSNRTWECYEFASILERFAESDELDESERKLLKHKIKNQFREDDPAMKRLKTVGMMAMLGDLIGDTPEQKNKLKKTALQTGLGEAVSFPDNWDELSEEEKAKRLDGAVEAIT